MTGQTVWQTDDPCPACGTILTILDDGDETWPAECRSCGYADTWTISPPGPANPRAEARQASQWLLDEYELTAAALANGLSGCLADGQKQRFLGLMSPGPMITIKDG